MIRSTAAANDTLRDFAVGYSQDLETNLGDWMAPRVATGVAIGQFKRYDINDAFAVYDTARAVGGAARRVEFLATDPQYNCQPQSLETPIDDAERTGPAAVVDVDINERAKTLSLLNLATTASSNRVALKAQTLAAVGGMGNWGDAAADPVSEMDACFRDIATKTGRFPNRVAFGTAAFERFKNHVKTRDRKPNWSLVRGTIFTAPGLWANPAAQALVAVTAKNTAHPGGAAAMANLLANDVFIFYADAIPTAYSPQWMSRFTTRPNGISDVRIYRDEKVRSDVLALDWSEDIQIVSSLCAARITTAG